MGKSTPAEVLADNVVLTMTQLAYVLGLTYTRGKRKGEPDRLRAVQLVRDGVLPLVDPDQVETARWTVSTAHVHRYLDGRAA